jgi:hypothetical protein
MPERGRAALSRESAIYRWEPAKTAGSCSKEPMNSNSRQRKVISADSAKNILIAPAMTLIKAAVS